MPEYEIYVSPAGIRVCSAGRDRCYQWDVAAPTLESCHGHQSGPEAAMAGVKPEGTRDRD